MQPHCHCVINYYNILCAESKHNTASATHRSLITAATNTFCLVLFFLSGCAHELLLFNGSTQRLYSLLAASLIFTFQEFNQTFVIVRLFEGHMQMMD